MNPDRGYRKSAIPDAAKRVFEGVIFDVYQWEQKLYDGSTATFERLLREDTVVVFPVLQDGTIMLIEDMQPDREMLLTPPAGRMEEGEVPAESAARELEEETGYRASKLELWYEYKPFHKIDWIVHVFIGHGCVKVSEPNPDAGEKIEPHPIPFDALADLIVTDGIRAEGCAEIFLRAKLDPIKMQELRGKFEL